MIIRSILTTAAAGVILLGTTGARSDRPEIIDVNVAPLFADPELVAKLPEGVRYTFVGDESLEVIKVLSSTASNRMSMRGARTRADACRWALLAALKGMGDQARKAGGNAVIDIHSAVDDQPGTATTFRCRLASNVITVSLNADLALVK